MTDSVNGPNPDETPDEVDQSGTETLDEAVKAALDALEAKLDRMAAGTEGDDVADAQAEADEGEVSDEEIDGDAEDDDAEDDEEFDDEDAVPVPKKVRRTRKRSYAPAGRVEHNPWAFLGPLVAVLAILTLLPLVRLIFDSLFERSLTAPDDATFSHVRNFIDVVDGRDWWLAVALTLVVVTVAVLAQLLLGAAFAGTLRRITFGGPWVQALLLAPFVLMPAAVATAWRDGWVDGFAISWFRVEPGGGQLTALATLLSHEVWRGTGITTVILLAGLSRVKPSLLDAAIADGATARQRITHVVLPAVAPAVAVVALYRSLDALRSIEAPVLIADSLGDLSTASHLVWTTSFTDFEIGLGAAMALLLILLAAGLGLLLTLLMQVRRAL
jgi:multiple sugar transport system permease protein